MGLVVGFALCSIHALMSGQRMHPNWSGQQTIEAGIAVWAAAKEYLCEKMFFHRHQLKLNLYIYIYCIFPLIVIESILPLTCTCPSLRVPTSAGRCQFWLGCDCRKQPASASAREVCLFAKNHWIWAIASHTSRHKNNVKQILYSSYPQSEVLQCIYSPCSSITL